MANLLYKIFLYNPEERLSTEEVVAHKWFQMQSIGSQDTSIRI